jgi:hypothetical protein
VVSEKPRREPKKSRKPPSDESRQHPEEPYEDQEDQAWPAPESALRGARGSLSPAELLRTLKTRDPKSKDGEDGFPEEPEIEYERSVIRIPFYLKRAEVAGRRRKVDIMNFDAYMRLIREAPIRSGLGVRQFEFYIDAWELTNTFSTGLNANVTFTLADTVQPKSLCVALHRNADYPAMIVYNAIYDIYLGSERIVEKQPGTAFATPVWTTPPRNVTVAFEKPFESDLFAFSAGTCEGMRSITREEFEKGIALARAIRSGERPESPSES